MSKRFLAFLLCLCVLGSVLCSCDLFAEKPSDEKLIQKRIDRFLHFFNAGDLEGVLSCMDSKTRKTYQSAINIGEGIAGMLGAGNISLSDLFGVSVGLSENDELLSVEIYSIEVEDDAAEVIVMMSYNQTVLGSTVSHEENTLFEMKKEDDDWYIRDFNTYYGDIEND